MADHPPVRVVRRPAPAPLTRLLLVTCTALALQAGGTVQAALPKQPAPPSPGELQCGTLRNNFGPFDYRTDRDKLPIVEEYHFTPEIELLIRGKTGTVAGDLMYTLRAFPNHHRALVAITKLGERYKSATPQGLEPSIDCFFERALRFRSDDTIVRLLFANYLNKTRRPDEALAQLAYARTQASDNPLTHYNIGLLYFDMGRYTDALAQAHRALALGNQRTELMDKLKAKGQWSEPPATPEPAASEPAAAASAPAS